MAFFGDSLMSPLGSKFQSPNSRSSGAIDIEKEAAFVDQIILKLGTLADLIRIYCDNFSMEYWSFINNQKLESEASVFLTEAERVDFAQKYFTGTFVPSEVVNKYQKNAETSRLLRDHGNGLYKQKNFEVALHYYNLALVFAETDSEAAGMAYANRSAVLVELGCFQDALEDIEYALKNKYPKSKSPKLEQRRTKCHESVLRKLQEYEAIEPKLRMEMEEEMKQMKEMREEMLRVKKSNPLMPAAAESVEIKFDEVEGRHLVVNEDVPPGTVLTVENPYVFTLDRHLKWNLGHCHHCLKRVRRGIPCTSCVFAMYCDESCRSRAEIHHFECKCLPSFHASAAADHVLMAVRIILKVGPQELFRLFQTKDPSYFNAKHPYGTEADCKYESQSYLSLFHLATNANKLPLKQRLGTAGRAVMATEIINNETSYFEDIPQDLRTEFKKFVAGLMLRHIEAMKFNAVFLMDVEGLEDVTFMDIYSGKINPQRLPDLLNIDFGQFAGALYPVFALLNHSCDPNVEYVNHTRNGTMTVVASRSLKKGEKLFASYFSRFDETPISVRQAELLENYMFECHCIACEQKWPTQINFFGQMPTFCCPLCSTTFFGYEKASRDFQRCVLDAPGWKCGRCGELFKAAELHDGYRNKLELAVRISRLLQLGQPRKAFEEYVKLVEYFQHHVGPPNVLLSLTQDRLLKALSLVFYFPQ